jgi:hypothetical protein
MSPPSAKSAKNRWVVHVHRREVRLEVRLADGARHLVRYPEQLSIRPDSGRILICPDAGSVAVQVEPGDVVAVRAVPIDRPP